MTETNETYDLVPVTAAEKWWEEPPERFEFDGDPVLHVWHSHDDTTFPILVVYQLATEHRETSSEWVTVDGRCDGVRITRRVPKRAAWRYFKHNQTGGRYRAAEGVHDQRYWEDQNWWRDTAKAFTVDDFLKHPSFIETDAHGNPLQTPAAPPTRTPLTAEPWPKTNLGRLLLAIVDKIGRPDGGSDGLYITRAIDEADATVKGVRDGK